MNRNFNKTKLTPTLPMPIPGDVSLRVAALENSAELRDIYNHPHWMKLMEFIRSANDECSKHQLKMWAETHYQLAPLISWFHSCTYRYGLSFDIYKFVPLSRLIIEERCQERIKHYNSLLLANQKSVRYYENLLISVRTASNSPTAGTAPTRSNVSSCWSVLSDSSYQLGLSTDEEDVSRSPEWMNEPAAHSDTANSYELAEFTLPPSSFDLNYAQHFG